MRSARLRQDIRSDRCAVLTHTNGRFPPVRCVASIALETKAVTHPQPNLFRHPLRASRLKNRQQEIIATEIEVKAVV
jgi:hypothetical protein